MAFGPGTRLGAYEIQSLLGSGGMGEVYRAKDTKLARDVALKILPATFTNEPERVARFRREAQVLASLNHPHIGAIYGLDESGGTQFLVLELVDGESLDKRIARGRIPLDEALGIAQQIAEALEAAHEKGVIHRDLKPANIALTRDGKVKVLDFGLAKAVETTSAPVGAMTSPTITSPAMMTGAGVILGTAAYMSPEQAKGLAADERSDIWAFGCVLFEMLTGRRAFRADDTSTTLARVIEREPDWNALPADMPAAALRLLRRCLDKDPRRRLHDVADARIELEDVDATRSLMDERGSGAPGHLHRTRRVRDGLIGGAIGTGIVLTIVMMYQGRPQAPSPVVRLSLTASGRLTPQLSVAVSPDGRQMAFVSTDADGRSMLWIRALDSTYARAVLGTENAAHPFWSPDGRSLGFIAGGMLKRVDIDGASVQPLAPTVSRLGGAWTRDGTIIFSPAINQLATIPSTGGPVTPLPFSGAWPSELPDGRHFLYFSNGTDPKSRGVYVGSLDSPATHQLITSDFKAAYAPGYLLFVRNETLLAQPFDAGRLVLSGEPSVVAEGVWNAAVAAQASFSVNASTLAYVNATLYDTQLTIFDRSGRPQSSVTPPARYLNRVPQLSPSGKQLAIGRGRDGNDSVWLFDLADGAGSRFTLNTDWSDTPIWSSDGTKLAFMSGRGRDEPGSRLNLKNADGSGQDQILLEFQPPRGAALWDWSADGFYIVYSLFSPETKGVSDLWVLPLDGSRRPYPFLESSFHKTQAQISPDGRWVAYTSYETGKDEVYVQSFPKPGDKRQVSVDGGVQPRWRRDGRELFYLAANQTLMAVPISTASPFRLGRPTPLFRTKMLPQGSQSVVFYTAYDVSRDGQRFILNIPPEDPGPQVTVVLNWAAAIKR